MKRDRTEELLQKSVDYLNRVGMEGFTLASLAAGIGTSSRMLIYHFGSRDQLLAKAQALMRREVTKEWMSERFQNLGSALRRNWDFYVDRIPHMEFFFHLISRALEDPSRFVDVSETAVSYWADFYEDVALREGYSNADAKVMARTTLAMYRGLILDLTITGDREATQKAMDWFVELLERVSPLNRS